MPVKSFRKKPNNRIQSRMILPADFYNLLSTISEEQ